MSVGSRVGRAHPRVGESARTPRYGRGTSDASRGNVSRRRRSRSERVSPSNAMRVRDGVPRSASRAVSTSARVAECRAQRRARPNFQRSPARAFAAPRLEFANFEPLDPKTPRACREPFPRRARRAARARARAHRPSRSSRRRSPVQGIFRPPLPPARRESTTARPASPSSSTVLRPPRLRSPCLGSSSTRTLGACSSRADQVPHRQTRTARRPARPPRGPLRARALPQAVLPHGRVPPIRPRADGKDTARTPRREETRQVRRASLESSHERLTGCAPCGC